MAAYAALVSLMRVIHDLEHNPSPPISLDKEIVESLTEHITFFHEFLQHYNPPPVAVNDEEAADPLEMRIADTAYAAEDAIEYRIVESIQKQSNDVGSEITGLLLAPKELNLCRVIEEMDLIRKSVVVKVDAEKNKVLVTHDQVAAKNDLAYVARNETMVGSDDVLLEIMEKLTGGQPDCQVIPIMGMGGIGKTFLARNIYAQPLIKEHFDICAWATISQQYNTREILCEVFSQATNREKERLSGESEDLLGLELHQYLFGRRFLIVMDDMWSIDAWDKIQRFFPNNVNGSRILVTTRLSQLCSQLNNNYSLRMSFLNETRSWDLFSKTVFGEKSCPHELRKIGENIVDSCRGLPLSIVVVGGILKNMESTQGSWESIRDNLSSVVNMENDKHCLRLLKMSYNHLPVYLKPCFLYMGVFEEDDVIRVSTLIKHWASEGFLNPKNGEALEKTARRFLQDLIDRNLILIGELGSTGSIKSCKIHDLLRDLCLKEGQKEGLYHVIGKSNPSQSMNTQRRVVIPKNTSKKKARDDLKSIPYVRSVIWECGEYPPFGNLGFLRKLHSNRFGYFGNKMYMNSLAFRYLNLQHLAIEARGMLSFLPAVSLLWNLHTLIVSCPNDDPTLLADFWKMPQFRNIQFVDCSFCLPDPPSDGRDGDAVVIMENMHTLKGLRNFKCCEGVVKRIPNVKKLKLKYDDILGANYLQDEHFVGNIKSLCRLESLSFSLGLVCESFGAFVNSKLTFPQSLKKLSLNSEYYHFKWEDTLEMIGSLPLLEKLELRGGCFGEGKWETVEGQFPCLKYLKLQYCKGLENWTAAEEGTIFPRLEYLCIFALKQLKNIPSELGNIDTLKSIHLIGCEEGVVKSAKEMVVEQVELQGEEQLSFHVVADLWGENKHLQNLSGPNFQVI